MMKRLIATTALSLALAAPAISLAANPAPPATASSTALIKSDSLMHAAVRDMKGEKLGDIEGVLMDKAGKTRAVIVDVGGFLGMGEHRIAMAWNDLQVSDNGRKVETRYTKEQLKAMPAYMYPDQKARNTAFYDPNWYPVPGAPFASSLGEQTASADWHRLNGDFKTSKLMDAHVLSNSKDDIGAVKDTIADNTGKIRTVIVDVGGFLGVGSRQVALDFSKLQMSAKGEAIRLNTGMTKEQLKALPEYNGMLASNSDSMATRSGGKIDVKKK